MFFGCERLPAWWSELVGLAGRLLSLDGRVRAPGEVRGRYRNPRRLWWATAGRVELALAFGRWLDPEFVGTDGRCGRG